MNEKWNNGSGVSRAIKAIIYHQLDGKCFYCGGPLVAGEWGPDHANPQCRGGTHEIENLKPACRMCNTLKRDKTLEEYRRWIQDRTIRHLQQEIEQLRGLSLVVDDPECLFEAIEYILDAIPLIHKSHVTFYGDRQ